MCSSDLDANIGELSYPIYLCHLFIIGLVQWSPLNNVPTWPRHIFTIILVIVAALLLDRLLVLPLDRLRLKFGAKARIVSSLLGQEASPSALRLDTLTQWNGVGCAKRPAAAIDAQHGFEQSRSSPKPK